MFPAVPSSEVESPVARVRLPDVVAASPVWRTISPEAPESPAFAETRRSVPPVPVWVAPVAKTMLPG